MRSLKPTLSKYHHRKTTFWMNMESIMSILSYKEKEFAQFIEIRFEKFCWYKCRNEPLPVNYIWNLCEKLDISMNLLLNGELDYKTLQSHVEGNEYYIPIRHIYKASTKSYALRNILNRAEAYNLEDRVLKELQIKSSKALNQVSSLSIQTISEALEVTKGYFTEEDYRLVGQQNAYETKNTDYFQKITDVKSPRELYERMIEVEHLIETNWNYKIIRLNDRSIVFNSLPSEHMVEHFKRPDYSCMRGIKLRSYFCETLIEFIGFYGSKVDIKKTVHQGNPYCQFEIMFDDLKQL